MEPRQPGKLEILAALTTSLAATWYMIPERDRQLLKLRCLYLARRVSARLALREGRRGMRDELRGRDYQRYAVAFRLSVARDQLGRLIDGMRP